MKNNFKLATILIGLSPLSVAAQNVAEYNIDEIQVTGTRARMDMKSSVRMVQVPVSYTHLTLPTKRIV